MRGVVTLILVAKDSLKTSESTAVLCSKMSGESPPQAVLGTAGILIAAPALPVNTGVCDIVPV